MIPMFRHVCLTPFMFHTTDLIVMSLEGFYVNRSLNKHGHIKKPPFLEELQME